MYAEAADTVFPSAQNLLLAKFVLQFNSQPAFHCVLTIITLSWRNWVQLDFAVTNHTVDHLQIGLWGACVGGAECYSFHGEGLPWYLQATVFLAMIGICFEALIFCLCIVELLYLWNAKGFFPLKQSQLYLALVTVVVTLTMAVISGSMTLSGLEKDMWKIVDDQLHLMEAGSNVRVGRFTVSQAWGYQVLVSISVICFVIITKSQLTRMSAVQDEERPANQRRIEVVLVSPPMFRAPNLQLQYTPPPAYSPPPAYDGLYRLDEMETPFILRIAQEENGESRTCRSGTDEDTATLIA
ncbi:uncharacterized protein LOC129590133 isoform X2 [Paramacrobiotus metropolitanus]|uniref:uncharacterized protein LOC129590133 isoform X2 n=1 Tax=Paramacrobiotus metropolitanus TaxID=2943436 RepID=UPI002445F8C5|nr:uncharacterized protein LOC129590133 isoform X2 [Paramacrobiotus metropolitanus]